MIALGLHVDVDGWNVRCKILKQTVGNNSHAHTYTQNTHKWTDTHTHICGHTHVHTHLLLYCFRLNGQATPSVGTDVIKSFPTNIDAFVYCIASFASKVLLTCLAFKGSFLLMYRFFSFTNAFVSLQVTNASVTFVTFKADNSL